MSQIRFECLRELQRELRRLNTELPKELRGRLRTIAARVAGLLRGRLPHLSGKLASRTQPRATTRTAGIAWRGLLYAGPVEFGGWPKGRPYVAKGRYIFPTVEAERSEIEAELERISDEFLAKAGLS
jgi:hypothetical protein